MRDLLQSLAPMDGHRNAAAAELAGKRFEYAGERRRAVRALAVGGHVVGLNFIPVAHDERLVAARAVSGAAGAVVHVAGVYVLQPLAERNRARASSSPRLASSAQRAKVSVRLAD